MATKSRPRFQTQRNFVFRPYLHTARVTDYTETVPAQGYSIKEILEKFTRGVDPYLTKNPIYHEISEDMEDMPVNTVPDFTDIEEAQQFISDLNLKIEDLRKNQDRLEREARLNKIKPDSSNTIEKGVPEDLKV